MGRNRAPAALKPLADSFVAAKQVAGCTSQTTSAYGWWLDRLVREIPDTGVLDVVALSRFFSRLRARGLKPASIHKARTIIGTFIRWLIRTRVLRENPLEALDPIRLPKALPVVPTPEEMRAVLKRCGPSLVGRRNRAMLLVIADSAVRKGELIRLRLEHWDPAERSLTVRVGKGQKDRVVFISGPTQKALRQYLELCTPPPNPEDPLFASDDGEPLKPRHVTTIVHRLCEKAGLPRSRRIRVHRIRGFATSQWLDNGVSLDEARRMGGWADTRTLLLYNALTSRDAQQSHRKAAVIERLGLA